VSGKPGGSYSSSRLDLTGENVTDLTREIATNQPVLSWLHSGEALALYQDPYIHGILRDPVGAVARIYQMRDPDGNPVGRQYLNSLFSDELGHPVEVEDLVTIGAQFFTWMEKKITGFRGLELVKYLSAADSAEKLIAGSLIKEAIEASEKHSKGDAEDIDASKQPPTIQEQLTALKKNQPQLYQLLVEQLKRAAAINPDKEPEAGSDTPSPPKSFPVLGETRGGDEEQPQGLEVGERLSMWLRMRRRRGFLGTILEVLGRWGPR